VTSSFTEPAKANLTQDDLHL